MSLPSPLSKLSNESLPPSGPEAEPDADPERRRDVAARSFKEPLQFVGFWGAIALPFVQVAILAHGLTGPTVFLAFCALVVVNVLALYVGHGYNQA